MPKKDPNKTTLEIVPVEGTKKLKMKDHKFKEPSAKFKRWAELFFDKSNPRCYGNKTQCALVAYNTKNYNSASCIGYQNYRKLQFSASVILELEGFGFGELVKIGASKMMAGSFSDWVKLMEILGYIDPKGKETPDNTFNFENLNVAIWRDRKARGLED